MHARSAGEALYIASEMEKSAISLYERALLVFPEARSALALLLADERAHLARFLQMRGAERVPNEEKLVLAAHAAGVLHPGGLMAAQRAGAFEDARALCAYAAAREREAIAAYEAFAEDCQGEASTAFLAIAREEKSHLSTLCQRLSEHGGSCDG